MSFTDLMSFVNYALFYFLESLYLFIWLIFLLKNISVFIRLLYWDLVLHRSFFI